MYLAVMGGLWYWLWGSCIFYTLWQTMDKPLVIGFFFGLVTGRMEECVVMGAAIQALYLGVIQPGGVLATEPSMAALAIVFFQDSGEAA